MAAAAVASTATTAKAAAGWSAARRGSKGLVASRRADADGDGCAAVDGNVVVVRRRDGVAALRETVDNVSIPAACCSEGALRVCMAVEAMVAVLPDGHGVGVPGRIST